MKDIHDVIKHANLGDDRLRGSGVVVRQISAFPIDFAGRPYNTLTLPELCAGEDHSCEIFLYADDSKICKVFHNQHDQ